MRKALLSLTFIGVGTLLGIVGTQFSPLHAQSERTPPKVVVDDTEVQRDGKFTTSFAPVVKKVAPSVVSIFASRTLKPSEAPDMRRMHPFFNDPAFREFFGDPSQRPSRRQREEALGSGVVVSEDGYILTSNHVIEEADEIKVELLGGRELTAKVIGTDPATDTAVIKVDATGLAAATLANSDKLEVGDVALAIGNPFGIGQTVTMGIISATGRGDLGIVAYEDFIQTDASINMGNSGGALVDAQGRLIGINTAILSPAGGNVGIGFAVPSNMAVAVMNQLIENGEVRRGRIGIGIQDVTPDLAEALGLDDPTGAVIANVELGSTAESAGLKVGDVVTAVDGQAVHSSADLRNLIGLTPVGSEVTLTVKRDGGERQVTVRIAEALAPPQLAGTVFEGASLRDASAAEARGSGAGVVVEHVAPGSSAARAGLLPGDLIVAINRMSVTSLADMAKWLADGPDTLAVELVRAGTRLLLVVR